MAAKALIARLADIEAANSVADLVAGRPREISANDYALDLDDGYLLVFTGNHHPNPTDQNGLVDWSRVSRIKITSIAINP